METRGHALYEVLYDRVDFGDDDYYGPHGGLTFSDKCQPGGKICHVVAEGEDDDVWWLGFDCAHMGDLTPGTLRWNVGGGLGETYKSIQYVTQEVTEMARQIAAAP